MNLFQAFWLIKMFPFPFFPLPQGYEYVLCNPQRLAALGLQAAGWQGLQHASHRVKGKKAHMESAFVLFFCICAEQQLRCLHSPWRFPLSFYESLGLLTRVCWF